MRGWTDVQTGKDSSLRSRVELLAARHDAGEVDDGFGGYECRECDHSWTNTLGGCRKLRELKWALGEVWDREALVWITS